MNGCRKGPEKVRLFEFLWNENATLKDFSGCASENNVAFGYVYVCVYASETCLFSATKLFRVLFAYVGNGEIDIMFSTHRFSLVPIPE